MPRRCAFGCESINITMHRLPNRIRNPDLFKTWVKLVGGKLESISDYEHYQKKRICDIHFIDSDRNQHNRLNAKAFPSLHIPRQLVSKLTLENSSSSTKHSEQETTTQLINEGKENIQIHFVLHNKLISISQLKNTVIKTTSCHIYLLHC
ncbi:uncharacterized protein LOC114245510 [Bombyx mandarina]|uniref:Uncharacterized protein LOC114245510 n=1 Tax=Bombyx mandarina TaxID=7092 RepID=A0A6J2JXD3_BOMMA|nr:uncharacterized protein LOC114245510 [Bombyx mandarina]